MHGQCVLALYRSRDVANRASLAVREAGISNDHIRICAGESAETTSSTADNESGFWDWLFGTNVPEADRRHYGAHFAEGGVAPSVFVEGAPSVTNIKQVEDILERYHPIDLHVEEEDADRMASSPLPRSSRNGINSNCKRCDWTA